jgi:hypothetical protein
MRKPIPGPKWAGRRSRKSRKSRKSRSPHNLSIDSDVVGYIGRDGQVAKYRQVRSLLTLGLQHPALAFLAE